jgi:hypothetical protein
MKRCPQCNSVFDDSLIYCTNDGSPLAQETFVMPSQASLPPDADAEEITVIHREPVAGDPITIDIPNPNPPPIPTEQLNYQMPTAENVIPVIIEKPRNTGKYLLFLFLGLILGGGLVLAAILFSMYLSQRDAAPPNADATSRNSTTATPTASKTPTPTPVTASAKHEKPTDAPDDDFNGRVITLNAYVRSSPSRSAKETDVLPIDDRLTIEERANDNSPWFRVTCEHGTTGWMHGNTIEYK